MRNKLFTASVDKMLFKQYPLGDDLEKQKVVAKIFNPYGDGRWYLLNSDPEDPDYIWAIVSMFGNVEIGSVSRSELLGVRVRPFGLPLERDLYFTPQNAAEVYRGLLDGKFYEDGGEVKEMKQLWFVTDSRGSVKNISTSVQAAEVFLASALKYDGVINYVKVPLKDWESEKVNVGNIRGYASSFWKSYKKGGKIPMIKEADIQVGKVFELINGEVIEIKRLFAEPRNMDEPWAEYVFRGETSENSVNYLKNFINAWRPMQNGFAKGGEMSKGGISNTDRQKSIAKLKRKIKHFREVEKSEPMARYYEEALFYMTEGKENDILKRGKYADGGIMDEATIESIHDGFTIAKMNDLLLKLFPYSFGFEVFKPVKGQDILLPDYDEAPSALRGYSDADLKSKLYFPNYKRNHDINFCINQGGENTYFYFTLNNENGDFLVGTFGFKDRGDVSPEYITSFIAFLMQCYDLPFKVKHTAYAKGGSIYGTGNADFYEERTTEPYDFKDYPYKVINKVEVDYNLEYDQAHIRSTIMRADNGHILRQETLPISSFGIEKLYSMLDPVMRGMVKRKFAKGGYMAKGGYITPDEYREKLENMTDEELIEEIRYEKGIDVDAEELENERETYISELVFKYRQVMGSRGYRYAKGGHMAKGGEIVKERNGKLYREEWAGSNRWLEVDSQFKMTKDEHEAKAFQENLNGNYESRDNHKHIAATLSGEPIQLQEHHNRYMAKGGEMKNESKETDFYAITKWHTGEVKLVPIKNVSFWQGRQNDHEPTKENLELFFKQIPWDESVCIYDNDTASDGTLHSAHTPLFTAGAKYVHGIVDKNQNPVHFSYKGFFAKGGSIGNFKIGDYVYHKKHNTIGKVIDVFDRGDVRTDADGVVYTGELEIYDEGNPKHKKAHIAPSTQRELDSRFAKGGMTNLVGNSPVKKYPIDKSNIDIVE